MDRIELNPIGKVKSKYEKLDIIPANGWDSDNISKIIVFPRYVDGLMGLNEKMLIHVLWWFDKAPRNILKNYIKPNDERETGVFAMRSPHRPNPIALSLCEIISISKNILEVRGLEALDGSPILDIKKAIINNQIIL